MKPAKPAPDTGLHHHQFQNALAAANLRFSLLRKKHPALKAYQVISMLGKQTKIDGSLKEMFAEFPAMLLDGEAKIRILEFLKTPEPKDATETEKEQIKNKFQELTRQLQYDPKCQIELRFTDLDYELLWKLQVDDLVDRQLTPQTKASINIVLGTISRFAEATNPESSQK